MLAIYDLLITSIIGSMSRDYYYMCVMECGRVCATVHVWNFFSVQWFVVSSSAQLTHKS